MIHVDVKKCENSCNSHSYLVLFMSSSAQHELGSDIHQLPGQRQAQARGHVRAAGARLRRGATGPMGGGPHRRPRETHTHTHTASEESRQCLTGWCVSFRSG